MSVFDIVLAILFTVLGFFLCKLYLGYQEQNKPNEQITDNHFCPDYKLLGIRRFAKKEKEIVDKIEFNPAIDSNKIIRLSVVQFGNLTTDIIVYCNSSMQIIVDNHPLQINKTVPIDDKDFQMLQNIQKTLKNKEVTNCPDGEPGLNMYVTIHGRKPMSIYGSTMMDDSSKAAYKFVDYCKEVSKKIFV